MNLLSIPSPGPSIGELQRAVDALIARVREMEIAESATIQVQHQGSGGTTLEVKPSFGGGAETRPVWL